MTMTDAVIPSASHRLMTALINEDWDKAEELAAAGALLEINFALKRNATDWLRRAVATPRRLAMARAIVTALPAAGRTLAEAYVIWEDGDLASLLQAGVEPSVRFLKNCPTKKKGNMLSLLLNHGADPAEYHSEALTFVGQPLFSTLLKAGADLEDALVHNALSGNRTAVTHLVEQAWDLGKITKELLERTAGAWYASRESRGPEPDIFHNRLSTLKRMELIDIDLCDHRNVCVGLPQARVNARFVDFLTENAALPLSSVFSFMKSGADLSYNDHEPLRVAALRGNPDAFRLLLTHGGTITNYDRLLDTIARVRGPSPKTCTQLMEILLPHLDSIDYHGGRPLYHAVQHDNTDLAEYLLQKGANPWAASDFLPDLGTVSLIDPNDDTRMARLFRDILADSARANDDAAWVVAVAESSGADSSATAVAPGPTEDVGRRRPR